MTLVHNRKLIGSFTDTNKAKVKYKVVGIGI